SDTVSPSHTGRYAGYVYRLNDEQYLIDITGQDSTSATAGGALTRRGATARERIGLLARIKPLKMDIRASLTSGRGDALSGNASIDGYDQVPTGWTPCGPLDSAKAGIRTDTSMDGTLDIQGGFQWFGVTIVRGSLKTSGGGSTDAHFWGATMVQDSTVVGNNTITGHANILYSKCAIIKALDKTGVVALMRSRGWVQLY